MGSRCTHRRRRGERQHHRTGGPPGQLKVNAEVVNNNAVGEQSAITGKHGVALQVGGQTQLTGGEIRSQQGKVELGGSKVSQQDVSANAIRAAAASMWQPR